MDPQQQPTNTPQSTPPNDTQPVFTPPDPEAPKNKKMGLIIAAAVAVVVILSVVAYAMLAPNKEDGNKNANNSSATNDTTEPSSDKYQKYDVTDAPSGIAFTVSFYKGAKVEEKNGRTYLNSGEAGSMYSVYLGVATGENIDCGESPTTTMNLGGESTTVCYDSDYMQYAGYAKANSGLVKINLAGQKPISLDDAKAIMESVTF